MESERKGPIVEYAKLTIPNHQRQGHYILSKRITGNKNTRVYNADDISDRVQVDYSRAREKLMFTDRQLELKRQIGLVERKKLDAQWEELEKKELSLRDNFLKFQTFFVENFEKRNRAHAIIREQKENVRVRQEALDKLSEEFRKLNNVRTFMEGKIEDYSIYGSFLKNVCALYPYKFACTEDIIKRHATLIEAKRVLGTTQEVDLRALENARNDMVQMIERQCYLELSLQNKLSIIHQKYETVKLNCMKWENICSEIQLCAKNKIIEAVSVQDSCRELYLQINELKHTEPDLTLNYEQQFIFIKRSLKEVENTIELVKKWYEDICLLSTKTKKSKKKAAK